MLSFFISSIRAVPTVHRHAKLSSMRLQQLLSRGDLDAVNRFVRRSVRVSPTVEAVEVLMEFLF